MTTIDVEVQQDHYERLVRNLPPTAALAELIWNGVDADATRIDVRFDTRGAGPLLVIDAIRVADDGHGITPEDAQAYFGRLGGSWKSATTTSRVRKRRLHGRAGVGRYAGFRFGNAVTWNTTFGADGEIREFEIRAERGSLRKFEVGEPQPTKRQRTGTEVSIVGLDQELAGRLRLKATADALTRIFALYLRAYPDVSITVDSLPLDPTSLIAHTADYDLTGVADETGEPIEARLTIIEWTRPFDRLLLLCDGAGFTLAERQAGIKAPGFHFTAFLRSDAFRAAEAGNRLALVDMSPSFMRLIDTAQERMREHFRLRAVELHKSVIERLKEEGAYPYEGPPADPVERVERQVFDVVAINIDAHLPGFDRTDTKTKAFTMQMVRQALERGPGSLQKILRAVVDLPAEKQAELADLVDRTSLAAIIDSTQTVRTRLDFLAGLDKILFDKELKKALLERRGLHRILVHHTWLFGEEYTLAVDDQSLTEVLRRHKKYIGRSDDEDLAPVLDAKGSVAIVDAMFSRVLRNGDEREHLVVELKRPSVAIDGAVATQIERYAQAIAKDERFHSTNTRWSFWAISNDMDDVIRDKVHGQSDRPDGLLTRFDTLRATVWVKTWGEILEAARSRLRFFEERLKYMADHDAGLEYLKQTYAKYLPAAAFEEK